MNQNEFNLYPQHWKTHEQQYFRGVPAVKDEQLVQN